MELNKYIDEAIHTSVESRLRSIGGPISDHLVAAYASEQEELVWLAQEAASALSSSLRACKRARKLIKSLPETLPSQETLQQVHNSLEDAGFALVAMDYGVVADEAEAFAFISEVLVGVRAKLAAAEARRRLQEEGAEQASLAAHDEEDLAPGACGICTRIMPLSFHHLYPRAVHKRLLKKDSSLTPLFLHSTGIYICRPCHSQIHRTVPDHMELALRFNSLDTILGMEAMQRWAAWASKQRPRNPRIHGLRYAMPSRAATTQRHFATATAVFFGTLIIATILSGWVQRPLPLAQMPASQPSSAITMSTASEATNNVVPDALLSPTVAFFSDKKNLLNQYLVKLAWGWTSFVFFLLVATRLATITGNAASAWIAVRRAMTRWMLATTYWYVMTQWCWGPPILDRVFVYTGGQCVVDSSTNVLLIEQPVILTAQGCRRSGGDWLHGHDVSGHAFLLIHAALFLVAELHHFIASNRVGQSHYMGYVPVVLLVSLWWWMLAVTGVFFHDWREKATGAVAGVLLVGSVYGLHLGRELLFGDDQEEDDAVAVIGANKED